MTARPGCPNDTNGDMDCGKPLCPNCGDPELLKQVNINTTIHILANDFLSRPGLTKQDYLELSEWAAKMAEASR